MPTPVDVTLLEVIENARNGDGEAMLFLLKKFEPLLNKYAKKLTLDYDDALQEVTLAFIELIHCRNLTALKSGSDGGIVSYIAKSIYHSYISISKKYKNPFIEESIDDINWNLEHQEALSASDCYIALDIEEFKTVLSEVEAFIFTMHYLQDIPIQAIAKRIGISRKNTNKKKNQALNKLKKFYKKEGKG